MDTVEFASHAIHPAILRESNIAALERDLRRIDHTSKRRTAELASLLEQTSPIPLPERELAAEIKALKRELRRTEQTRRELNAELASLLKQRPLHSLPKGALTPDGKVISPYDNHRRPLDIKLSPPPARRMMCPWSHRPFLVPDEREAPSRESIVPKHPTEESATGAIPQSGASSSSLNKGFVE